MFDRAALAWPGAPMALASAALFGASTPLAKLLLGAGVDPWLLAGLLYLGSGLGLGAMYFARRLLGAPATEASLRRGDLGWLTLVVIAGGVAGPLLLMLGLAHTPASSAALLLNVEGLATMLIAWLVFRENVDRRLLAGALAILLGAVVLSWTGGPGGVGLGAVAIIGACAAWGLDNNLTRKLSSADPVQIAAVKGMAAGTVNLSLALTQGAQLPSPGVILGAGVVGFFGYGVSLVLFVLALRHLGTAPTSRPRPSWAQACRWRFSGSRSAPSWPSPRCSWASASGCTCRSGTTTRTPTPSSPMTIGTGTMSTISTLTAPAIRPASRTPIGTSTRRYGTSIRIIRTCITITATRAETGRDASASSGRPTPPPGETARRRSHRCARSP
jgi:drug/metabolite transporter (DMT)-like permease